MVIAGAYHIHGLAEEDKKIKFGKYSVSDSGLYIMPYSFAEADSRSGYGAGIPFPAFYSDVWKKLCDDKENPYLSSVENFIVSTARYARSKQPVSLPDETEALYLANNLAALRGKTEPGAFELIDGVRSAFVKGNVNSTAAFELDYLYRRMTGMGAGEINLSSEGRENIIPPCVADFRALCQKHRLNIGTVARQSTVLEIVKKRSHYEKSCFFHRMTYLETSFCKRESGPDYTRNIDTALIRENWSYRYSTAVETRLIDLSVYGGSIETICRNMLKDSFEKIQSAEECGVFLLHLFTLGFSEASDRFIRRIYDIVRDDTDFVSQCRFMYNLNRLIILQKHTLGQADNTVSELMKISFETALCRFEDIRFAKGEICNEICEGIRQMYSTASEYPLLCNKAMLMNCVEEASDDTGTSPQIYGVCVALCEKEGRISEDEYGEAICIYMLSAESAESAEFLAGVISVGRDIIMTSRSVLESIDNALKRMDDDKFKKSLPRFRGAFTAFLPSETARISKNVAELYGTGEEVLTGSDVFSAQEIIRTSDCDRKVREIMEKWGLFVD